MTHMCHTALSTTPLSNLPDEAGSGARFFVGRMARKFRNHTLEEPSGPKTKTTRTVLCTHCNRTELRTSGSTQQVSRCALKRHTIHTIHTKTVTNGNLGFVFAFAFLMERQIYFPRSSFAFAFVSAMLGKHKPQQQTTLTKKYIIPEIFFCFRFRNPKERKS